ncbi:hypothetical protein [Pelagicoccus sp. SDUM812002]|uniref:hypothetical protein n=1 Tax=Pelagicoccus sp. SDUM812002 TaxID=3041266 RepID=UPI00280F70DD|nr:hypothetical protein [Pelagicoccus sp. SDUM812002]MDQ8188164.1 hypothetical protein [Pelagicoccus sp. SDUM812002]
MDTIKPLELTLCVLNILVWLLVWPSGYLHSLLGGGVYLREAFVLCVLLMNVFHFFKMSVGHSYIFLFFVVLGMIYIGLVCLFYNVFIVVEIGSLVVIKWVFYWFWALTFGLLGCSRSKVWLCFVLSVFLLCCVAEAGVGLFERISGEYFIASQGDNLTLAGNQLNKENVMFEPGLIRVKGFQRDVFTYCNVLLLGCCVAVHLGCLFRKPAILLCLAALVSYFIVSIAVSGGRSSLFGCLALMLAVLVWLVSGLFKKWIITVPIAMVLFSFVFSVFGFGGVLEFTSEQIFGGSAFGDLQSADMRERIWDRYWENLVGDTSKFIFGDLLVGLISADSFAVEFVDNQLLWMWVYFGFVGVLFYIFLMVGVPFRVSQVQSDSSGLLVVVCVVSAISAEGIARESIFFPSSIFLFFVVGLYASKPICWNE